MSDAQLESPYDLDEAMESDDSVGQSSEEASQEKKKPIPFSIFDGMLLLALICVTAATLILFLELRTFGNFPSVFPWRTSEVLQGSEGLLFPLF